MSNPKLQPSVAQVWGGHVLFLHWNDIGIIAGGYWIRVDREHGRETWRYHWPEPPR
jgi:hypothetical protein